MALLISSCGSLIVRLVFFTFFVTDLICVFCQDVFQLQVVGRRQGEFERLKRVREERLAEERALRSQEREVRRKKEYYKQQEEMRLQKIQEEEEAKKREGKNTSHVCHLIISPLRGHTLKKPKITRETTY